MKCVKCKSNIEPERLNVLPDTQICSRCAQITQPKRVKGRMVWDHKTAPYVQVMSEETYKANEKYYPKFGRGSGVHAMSKPSSQQSS